jgi:hypothetical protein
LVTFFHDPQVEEIALDAVTVQMNKLTVAGKWRVLIVPVFDEEGVFRPARLGSSEFVQRPNGPRIATGECGRLCATRVDERSYNQGKSLVLDTKRLFNWRGSEDSRGNLAT